MPTGQLSSRIPQGPLPVPVPEVCACPRPGTHGQESAALRLPPAAQGTSTGWCLPNQRQRSAPWKGAGTQDCHPNPRQHYPATATLDSIVLPPQSRTALSCHANAGQSCPARHSLWAAPMPRAQPEPARNTPLGVTRLRSASLGWARHHSAPLGWARGAALAAGSSPGRAWGCSPRPAVCGFCASVERGPF